MLFYPGVSEPALVLNRMERIPSQNSTSEISGNLFNRASMTPCRRVNLHVLETAGRRPEFKNKTVNFVYRIKKIGTERFHILSYILPT
ncbi:hypothetical protein DSECCO2_516680 [anaerobic digester metagenome]